MKLKKCANIKLSNYIEYIHTKDCLSYLRLTPHQNTRNYKSEDLAKLINRCYKSALKRFYRNGDKWYVEAPTKVGYYIYMTLDEGIQFYLIIPRIFETIFIEKIALVWEKVEVTKVDDIPRLSEYCMKTCMEYVRNDSLSLDVADKKSNEVLRTQLNVIDILKENDKVAIYYNFNYKSAYKQMGFKTNYSRDMDKLKDGKSLERIRLDSNSILRFAARLFVHTVEELLVSLAEMLGTERAKTMELEQFNRAIGIMQKKDLSKDTKNKGQLEVIPTQILLMSESDNKESEKMNINAMAQSFTVLDGDNEIRPKAILSKKPIDIDAPKFNIPTNDMSTAEVGNLILQPGREIITKYKIQSNSINEEEVPDVCRKGYIRTGEATKRGKPINGFLNPDPEQDTGLAITGKQGSGKTEELKNYAYDCINRVYESMENGDSVVVADYIGNNDLANSIGKIVPKHLLIEIDLSDIDKMESIAYPEKFYRADMDTMSKLDIISEKAQLIIQLLNSFSYGQDLTSAMRRFFISASNVVYSVNQYASFSEVIDCLENYDDRMRYIAEIPDEFKAFCEPHKENLLRLNDKIKSGEGKGLDSGETIESKIDRILDRVSVMRESPRLEYMITKDPRKNINFEQAFNEGKVILIKMRQDKFGTEHMRNMLTLFFMTRIWEACVNRYSNSNGEELRRVHFIIDEPHQVPRVLDYLEPILPQMRKYRLKPVFATQSLQQVIRTLPSMKEAGFSYMLLAGSDKVNYRLLSNELHPYQVEDLLNLERFHSLNLVPDDLGIFRPYITKLPKPLKY